ncbi:predicted protein [Naegleria gruberi]|uniref:Predicted protein n=1 Tax=Naegleria gruberi TaxID=5762 RepID=D2VTI6_NAEGR|nr:uncharacterized protein NAEGRDRAFT_72315 [Naegleria gruberi]EFC39941.1 predicted protein [Naegleria gruberi]|eukprot:XP_002672685.1 predicted protein [Naegleria gruberi strain NEG-M]
MPRTKIDILSELFETEVSFIQHIQFALLLTDKSPQFEFYKSHLQKFQNFISPNSQLVSNYSKTINPDNYQFLLEEFTSNLIKMLNIDGFLSTYIALCQPELRRQLAHLFCGRMPRYSLLYQDILSRESDEDIKDRIINPILAKLNEICTLLNSNFAIISVMNMRDEKFFQIENLENELVIVDVTLNIKKFMYGKFLYKKRKLVHGMIYFPRNSNQLILLKVKGEIAPYSPLHYLVEFGGKGKVVYSNYSIYKIIDMMECEINYKEEGIEIKKISKTITMSMDETESKIKMWNLICLKRYKAPMKFRINEKRPLYDVQFNFHN